MSYQPPTHQRFHGCLDKQMRDPQILEQVKSTLAVLNSKAPGRAIEVRIPPYAAVQCGEGPTHTRGTPPNTIEMDAQTWLALADGQLTWAQALADGKIAASGVRADLSEYLPLGAQL
jgi:putative sterol carrier protein